MINDNLSAEKCHFVALIMSTQSLLNKAVGAFMTVHLSSLRCQHHAVLHAYHLWYHVIKWIIRIIISQIIRPHPKSWITIWLTIVSCPIDPPFNDPGPWVLTHPVILPWPSNIIPLGSWSLPRKLHGGIFIFMSDFSCKNASKLNTTGGEGSVVSIEYRPISSASSRHMVKKI